MNKIEKIIIKFNLKLTEGAKVKSTFVIKDNYLFYEDYTDNPNESMFVADYYDIYTYKANSDFFKENFQNICEEITCLENLDNTKVDKSMKFTVTISYEDKTSKRIVFYNTLEENGLNELARLFKCAIPPCECYPHFLEPNEIYLDEKTIEYIEKIKNEEI